MTPDEILLLSQPTIAGEVADILRRARTGLAVGIVETRDALEAAVAERGPRLRLVAFATPVIVPADVLAALPGPAYNIHPGPPDYPGLFPSVFAIEDGAARFGVTVHEMAETIDSGPIVAVETFDMPASVDRMTLDAMAYKAVLRTMHAVAPALAGEAELPPLDVAWGSAPKTRADFEALCEIAPDISVEAFARRHRAVGEGPYHALTVTLHGRKFRLVGEGEGTVYVAGRAVDG